MPCVTFVFPNKYQEINHEGHLVFHEVRPWCFKSFNDFTTKSSKFSNIKKTMEMLINGTTRPYLIQLIDPLFSQ